jgi:hypothetical protein
LSKDGFFESDPDLVSGVVEEIGESDFLSAWEKQNWLCNIIIQFCNHFMYQH